MIDKVDGVRVGADVNPELIAMWRALQSGWRPEYVSRDEYQDIRRDPKAYPPHLVGWVAVNCSYSGKWWGGYAGVVDTREGQRDYQREALDHVMRQIPRLADVEFTAADYRDLHIENGSIVYCDPPYFETLGYGASFDHADFWAWTRELARRGCRVYVSEYVAPADFECIWSLTVGSSLSANGNVGGRKASIERLFISRVRSRGIQSRRRHAQ